jgi:DHA2 family lincomycin resistance protein-like MFS transporter
MSAVRKWTIIATVLVGAFVFSLNARGTVLETNLKVQAFELDRYKIQWITGAEGITALTTLFASVYLIKAFGARWVFLLGTACLAVGALGEAVTRSPEEQYVVVVLRSCAGFFAIPGITVLQRLSPGRVRFAHCTYLTMIYGGQVLVEPIGALVAFHPSWRALFAGIGMCAVALFLLALFLFPDDRPQRPPEHGFDFLGAGLFVVLFALVLFLLYRGNYLGWRVSTSIWIAAASFLIVLALFIWRELVAPDPFLNLSGFAFRTAAVAMLASAFWCAALYGVAIQLPNCLLMLGYEQWKTGWVMLPMGLIVVAVMFLGSFIGHRGLLVSLFQVGMAGMTLVGLWLARVDIYTPWQWVMGVSSLWAVFAGMCLSPIAQLAFEGQPPPVAGATGPLKFFMRTFNGTIGILLAGVLIGQGAWWGLEFVRDGIVQGQGAVQIEIPAMQDYLVRHGSTPATAAAQAQAVLGSWVDLHAQVIGYRWGLRVCAYLAAIGLIVSLFLHRRKESSVLDPPASPPSSDSRRSDLAPAAVRR